MCLTLEVKLKNKKEKMLLGEEMGVAVMYGNE